jgi:hypothetical protein
MRLFVSVPVLSSHCCYNQQLWHFFTKKHNLLQLSATSFILTSRDRNWLLIKAKPHLATPTGWAWRQHKTCVERSGTVEAEVRCNMNAPAASVPSFHPISMD